MTMDHLEDPLVTPRSSVTGRRISVTRDADLGALLAEIESHTRRSAEALDRMAKAAEEQAQAQIATSNLARMMMGEIPTSEPEDAVFLDYRENDRGDGFEVTTDGQSWSPANSVQFQTIRDMVNSRKRR
jgi:hypothetical protein